MDRKIIFFLLFLAFIHNGCIKSDKYSFQINRNLVESQGNRKELEKFLEKYQDNDTSLKYKAARFLLANISGHYSYDTLNLYKYRPILHTYDSLNQILKIDPNFSIGLIMDTLWNNLNNKTNTGTFLEKDLSKLSAEYLINDFENSFKILKRNRYRDSVSFNDFQEYVLPYRKAPGLAIEDWRSKFSKRHLSYSNSLFPAPLKTVVDSILKSYINYSHTYTIIPNFPYLKFSDFEISKRAGCETKCWFNSMIFASVGIPVTIDLVPAWGNRNGSHKWNALINQGKSYPFEPFWEEDKWKYKKLYNNQSTDSTYGDFKLPKVFRHSFSNNESLALLNKEVGSENIPLFFKNINLKDVSDQYFKTSEIRITVSPNSTKKKYMYLCVFNLGKWVPVNYAKIVKGTAIFTKMGRSITYLPGFYENGKIIPASYAFNIENDGRINVLNPSFDGKQEVEIKRKYPLFPVRERWSETLVEAKIQGANRRDFKDADDLHVITKRPNDVPETVKLNIKKPYRYVRLIYQGSKSGNLAEFEIYPTNNNEKVNGEPLFSPQLKKEKVAAIFDNNPNTFMPPYTYTKKTSTNIWVGIDMKAPTSISSIVYCARNDGNGIFPLKTYELFYWNNKWVSMGIKKAHKNQLIWPGAPFNALFLVKALEGGKEDRIFLYKNGKQLWK